MKVRKENIMATPSVTPKILPSNIMGRAVILVLAKHYIGTSKSVRQDKITIVKDENQPEPDKSWTSTSKTLFSSPKRWSIYTLVASLDARLSKYLLPSDPGIFLHQA
jgi:hypothetical protein